METRASYQATLEDAFALGYYAARAGKAKRSNPFPFPCPEWQEFNRGWNERQRVKALQTREAVENMRAVHLPPPSGES